MLIACYMCYEGLMNPVKPKPPTARVAMAMAKSQAYQDAADAPATLRAYASDLKNFEAWCQRNNLTALPATPEVVGAYLAAAGEGYAMQTLRRRVAAIARGSRPIRAKSPAKQAFEMVAEISRLRKQPIEFIQEPGFARRWAMFPLGSSRVER